VASLYWPTLWTERTKCDISQTRHLMPEGVRVRIFKANAKKIESNDVGRKEGPDFSKNCIYVQTVQYKAISTSLCSASYISCQRGTARIPCWSSCCGRNRCCRALSGKPESSGVRPANDGTDGQTDRRTPDRYKDPAFGSREKLKWETLRAEPITPGVLTISVNMRQ